MPKDERARNLLQEVRKILAAPPQKDDPETRKLLDALVAEIDNYLAS